jgi:hypothetical protein
MSEKHLTEAPWKTLANNKGVKDLGLQKALAAYNKFDPKKEASEALTALQEVNELALKLKKIKTLEEDVLDYLDEIIKEVKKTTPLLNTAIKATAPEVAAGEKSKPDAKKENEDEDEDEEKEAEEFKKDLKKQMVSALARVRSLAPGDPEQAKEPKPQLKFMAYAAGKNTSVIISRKVGSATKKLLLELSKNAPGGKFVPGECIFEKAAHTFVVDKAPPGLAKSLAAALLNETQTKYKVRVRTADGSMELDSDTDLAEGEVAATSTTAAGAAPSANKEAMDKFTARFRGLLELVKKNPGVKLAAGTPGEQNVVQAAQMAGGLAKKLDFVNANQLLDRIEQALKQPPSSKPATPKADTAAKAPAAQAPQAGQAKLSTYLNGRTNLRNARQQAEKELKRLREAILAKAAGEPFYKEVETRSEALFEYLAAINDSLVDKLDEAGRATDPEEQAQKNRQVQQIIHQQLESLRNHRLASFVQANPFGQFAIRQPLEAALSSLDQQLG